MVLYQGEGMCCCDFGAEGGISEGDAVCAVVDGGLEFGVAEIALGSNDQGDGVCSYGTR